MILLPQQLRTFSLSLTDPCLLLQYTHNYSLSVFELYSQINSPTVQYPSLQQLANGITSPLGDADDWVDYLGTCKPPAFLPCLRCLVYALPEHADCKQAAAAAVHSAVRNPYAKMDASFAPCQIVRGRKALSS